MFLEFSNSDLFPATSYSTASSLGLQATLRKEPPPEDTRENTNSSTSGKGEAASPGSKIKKDLSTYFMQHSSSTLFVPLPFPLLSEAGRYASGLW